MLKTHIEPQKTIFKSIKSENNSTFSVISIGSESSGIASGVASSRIASSGIASSGMSSGNTDSKSLKINKISFIISSLYDHVILTLLNQRQTQQSLFTLVPPPPPQILPQINQAAKKTVLKPQTVSDDNPITCLLASLPIRSVDSIDSDQAEEKYEFMLFTTATNGLLSCYSCAITMRNSMRDSVDDSMRDSIPIDAATRLTYQMKSGHQAIVLCMASSHDLLKSHSTSLNNSDMEKMAKNNLLLATGSADSTIRVWNGLKGFITHNLKGHAGIISALAFAPIPSTLSASKSQTPILLASASDDCTVRVWDLAQAKGVCVAVLRDHVAVVRELAWHPVHGKFLYSGSRDRVFIKWSVLEDYKAVMTIPTYESIETLKLISIPDPKNNESEKIVVCTGGEQGALKLWDSETGNLLYTKDRLDSSAYEITSAILSSNSTLHVLTSDQTFQEFSLVNSQELHPELHLNSSIVAHTDQVLNVKFLSSPSEILLTTNAFFFKCINISSGDTTLTYGHQNMIISLAVSKDSTQIATGCKDASIIVWTRLSSSTPSSASTFSKLFQFTGHTSPITSIAFGINGNWLLSGSADKTVKKWSLSSSSAKPKQSAQYTFLAHENDITAIKASPCGTLFLTASLDKTAKSWSLESGAQVTLFKGHRRPISSLDISPLDKTMVTSSQDSTIKLWSLQDGSCLQTLESNTPPLCVSFLASGLQLVATTLSGLLQLWTIRDSGCVVFESVHEDKIWSMDVDGEWVVTGSAEDAAVVLWRDKSMDHKEQELEKQDFLVEKQNDLHLHLERQDYPSALLIALTLNMPLQALKIFIKAKSSSSSFTSSTGSPSLDHFISKLPLDHLRTLLTYLKSWSTSPKHTAVVHDLLSLLLRSYPPSVFLELGADGRESLEAIRVYAGRHEERVRLLSRDLRLVDYVLDRMDVLL